MNARIARIPCLAIAAALAWCTLSPALAEGEAGADMPAVDFTRACEIVEPSSGRSRQLLADGKPATYAAVDADEGLICRWTDEEPVEQIYIEWYERPARITILQYDQDGAELSSEAIESPLVNDRYAVDPEARALTIVSAEEMTISELRLLSAGALPEGAHDWEEPVEKADLLVIAAHPDDELLYFGGTIPTYAGERGLAVQVAYMAFDKRVRQNEAMEGLWTLRVRNAPVFLGFRDAYSESLASAERRWGREETLEALVALIRRFRPEVIVTHDLAGEYGHGAHMLTAAYTLEAVTIAGDGAQFTESAERYGAWQVKKLYLHLCQNGAITMDWRVPLAAFGGKTALEMANIAYACHVSQQEYHQNVYDTGDHSSAAFGLAYTLVGFDEAGGDFFEHIEESALTDYIAPTPSPAPTLSPTPSPTGTPEPVTEALSTTAGDAAQAEPHGTGLVKGLLLGGAVLAAAALAALVIRIIGKRRRKRKKTRIHA